MNRPIGRRTLATGLFPLFGAALVVGACGGGSEPPKVPADPQAVASAPSSSDDTARHTTPLVAQGAAVSGDVQDAPDAETPEQVYARVQADLVACYEQGRKAIPTMSSGKVTLNVSIDREGKSMCVVASDDSGLSQDVEDCMSARMARDAFKSNGATWTTELPILVKGGKVSLGPPPTNAPAIETIETHGLPDSAHEVVAALLPQFHKCTEGMEAKAGLRVMHVGARVAKDGRVECAIASSGVHLPAKMRDCAAGALAAAKFPAPSSSVGLVSVPVKILSAK